MHELGLARWVRWIPRQTRHELIRWYNLSDAVLDQFLLGDYGGCAFEAWSCGKPVFLHLNSFSAFGQEDPPAVNVQTEQEIYDQLVTLTDSPDDLRQLGRKAREWVLKYQHGDALVGRYLACYRQILNGQMQ